MRVLLLSPYPESLRPALDQVGDTYIEHTGKIDKEFCQDNKVKFIISFGYRHIIDASVLGLFPLAAINLHISMLPSSRGAHPVFWSIVEDRPLGVTIHLLDECLDTGNILYQKQVVANVADHTFSSLYRLHCSVIIKLFSENWKTIRTSRRCGRKQIGLPTLHRASDLERWTRCMPNAWETPISVFRCLAAQESEA